MRYFSRGPLFVLALAIALPWFVSCSSDGGGNGAACSADADCASGSVCVFPIADGCSAKSSCQPKPTGAQCRAAINYCRCSGGTVAVGCGNPDGYAVAPVSGPQGVSTCGPTDAGGD